MIELSVYKVQFQSRELKKAQEIIDFIVEYSGPQEEDLSEKLEWVLHIDG